MSKIVNIPEYSVSEFNKSFKKVIDSNFGYVRIKGEISELKTATKGQIYLTFKDENSILSGVIWENKKQDIKFSPEVGVEVVATGKITTWSKYKTTYQIDIDNLEISGEGALLKLIQNRKEKLRKQGFFEQKHKKELPFFPTNIGVITSPTGSVIHDITNRIKDRFPTNVLLWPVPVQGSNSAELISKAIKGFNGITDNNRPDVIIIARGGGSTEDLMAFNDELLAIEVFNSSIPIVSAIGHETDTTIIDLISDLRASTPSAAAEIVVPVRKELENNINYHFNRINNYMINILKNQNHKLHSLNRLLKAPNFIFRSYTKNLLLISKSLDKEISKIIIKNYDQLMNYSKMIKSPNTRHNSKKNEFVKLYYRLHNNIDRKFNDKKKYFFDLSRLFISNSINKNLKKGYVVLSKSKKILKKSSDIKKQDSISIKFFDKAIDVNLKKIN